MAGKTVTRADLSEAVYQKVGLSRTESSALVESVLSEICDCLAQGETVKLSSFGSFVVRDKGQRVGPQPEDRHRGADRSPARHGLQALERPQGAHQRREGRGRRGLSALRPAERPLDKSPDAFRTISEVADDLRLPQHVLRFWETRFPQIRPLKRGGGRRYYRPDDVDLLKGIRHLLYGEGYTIKGVQRS
jgi:nucleoid DNA-binding protein